MHYTVHLLMLGVCKAIVPSYAYAPSLEIRSRLITVINVWWRTHKCTDTHTAHIHTHALMVGWRV